MFESLNGVPSHIFFVHAPVVLVPLLTIGALALLVRPAWRRPYAIPLALMATASFVATMFARQSGLAFDELLDGAVDTEQHEQLGDQTALIVFILMGLCMAGVFVLRRGHVETQAAATDPDGQAVSARAQSATSPTSTASTTASTSLTAAIALVSILATIWMIRTGDVGARLVWEDTIPGL